MPRLLHRIVKWARAQLQEELIKVCQERSLLEAENGCSWAKLTNPVGIWICQAEAAGCEEDSSSGEYEGLNQGFACLADSVDNNKENLV